MADEKVLVVDDEPHLQDLIKFNLGKLGYRIICADNGMEGIKAARENRPQLILLDIILPDIDGFEVCKEIRREKSLSRIPIIIVSAKDEELDKILGLELGADDYITKPFSIRELTARVKAVLRRTIIQPDENIYEFGEICIDFKKHEVLRRGERVELTIKEFELLKLLVKNEGRILTREFLLETIWRYEYLLGARTIDVHIRHLRAKLEDTHQSPRYIETVRRIGYRFTGND